MGGEREGEREREKRGIQADLSTLSGFFRLLPLFSPVFEHRTAYLRSYEARCAAAISASHVVLLHLGPLEISLTMTHRLEEKQIDFFFLMMMSFMIDWH